MKNILELAKESFHGYKLSTESKIYPINAVPDSVVEPIYTAGFNAGYAQAVRSTPPLNTSDGELCSVCELCYQPKPRVPHANGWVWVYKSWICDGCYRRTTGAGLKLKDHPGGCFAAGRPDPRKTVPHNPDSPVKCGCCKPGVAKLREDLEHLNGQIAINAETVQGQIDKLQDKIHKIMDGYAIMLDHLVMADVKSTENSP